MPVYLTSELHRSGFGLAHYGLVYVMNQKKLFTGQEICHMVVVHCYMTTDRAVYTIEKCVLVSGCEWGMSY